MSKPAGLTVHKTRRNRATLSSNLKRQLARKVFPVHRLDHRTSGAILFAFNAAACGKLHRALRTGNKQYVALLRGEWLHDEESVTVNKPLRVDEIEKEASTTFTVLASGRSSSSRSALDDDDDKEEGEGEDRWYDPSRCSLVLCEPKTGRTHQIRRHARSLSQPILGDTAHGDTKVNRWWRTHRNLDRLALHCLSLDLSLEQGLDDDNDDDDDNHTNEEDKDDRTICVAPLPLDLLSVLQHPGLADLWQEAIKKEPRLTLEPIDNKGGSFGRNYKNRVVADEKKEDTK